MTKVISVSHSSVQGGYSRSASSFPPHGHSGTQANIQHVASEVSASTTTVASGKGERANPTDFLLKEQGRGCSHSFHSHFTDQSSVTLSHPAAGAPEVWFPTKQPCVLFNSVTIKEGEGEWRWRRGWSVTISTIFCILVIHHYLKI